MKVADLLNNLATASGILVTDPVLAKLVTDTASIELPDEINTKINSSFMTLDAAKSNPTLKAHFQAQAYSGIDNTLKESLLEAGFKEEDLKDILIDKKTGQSLKNAFAKVTELHKKVTDPSATKIEKDEAVKQINALNQKIAEQATEYQKSLSEKERLFGETLSNVLLDTDLTGYKYVHPTSPEANILTAKTLYNQELKEKGLKLITENNKIRLVTNDNADYFENNKKIVHKEFLDSVVAKHKLIEVSAPGAATTKTITTKVDAGAVTNKFAQRATELAESQQPTT